MAGKTVMIYDDEGGVATISHPDGRRVTLRGISIERAARLAARGGMEIELTERRRAPTLFPILSQLEH